MPDLAALRLFLTVADQRSFAAAARALSLTPASATRAIAALEGELGVQLLLRTTRKVSLTAAGAVYAERVRPLVAGLDAAADEVRAVQGIASGRVRVSAPMSMGLRLLPHMVAGFTRAHPEMQVSLSLTDQFVDILSGEFDLAIRISAAPTDKSTIWRKLCPVPRLLVASADYVEGRPQIIRPQDLDPSECLAYSATGDDEVWDLTGPDGTRTSLRAGGVVRTNSGDLLGVLAAEGAGIALLPHYLVADDLAAGRLVAVLPDWTPPEIWLTLFYPPYDALPLRVAAFSDYFEDFVTRMAPL